MTDKERLDWLDSESAVEEFIASLMNGLTPETKAELLRRGVDLKATPIRDLIDALKVTSKNK